MKNLLFLCAFLMITTVSWAQSSCDRWTLGIDFNFLTPLDEMKANGFKEAYGVDFDVFYNMTGYNSLASKTGTSFHLGARFNVLFSPGLDGDIEFAEPAGATGEYCLYNALIDLQGVGRFIFNENGRIKPYTEIFAGPRIITGQESLELDGFFPDYEDNNSEELITDVALGWGGSVGTFIQLSPKVDFNIRMSYSQSKALDYIDLKSADLKDNIPNYTVNNAVTDALNFQVGVRIKFCNDRSEERYETRTSSRSCDRRARRKYKKLKRKTNKS